MPAADRTRRPAPVEKSTFAFALSVPALDEGSGGGLSGAGFALRLQKIEVDIAATKVAPQPRLLRRGGILFTSSLIQDRFAPLAGCVSEEPDAISNHSFALYIIAANRLLGTMLHLIVGGRSEAGRSAARVLARLFPEDECWTTTSRSDQVEERCIGGIDLNDPAAVDRLIAAWQGRPLQTLLFTPAFGPIGFPVRAATIEEARAALAFSFDPMVRLAEATGAKRVIGYSAFFWLPHSLVAYGAMAYAKLALERICERQPETFGCVRAGTFVSPATRGISLLLQRRLRDTPFEELRAMGAEQKASGKKFSEFFFEYASRAERKMYGDRFPTAHRPTNAADLEASLEDLLRKPEGGPIACVIGDWRWRESTAPTVGADFKQAAALGL